MTRKKSKNKKKTHSRRLDQKNRAKSVVLPGSFDVAALEAEYLKDPANIGLALQLAEAYYKSNQETKIPGLLKPIESADLKKDSGERFRYLTLLAIGYAFTGELTEAEQLCEQGLSEYPDALDFYYALSYLKLSMREYTGAQKYGEKYLQLLQIKPVLEQMPLPLCGMMAHLSQLQNFVGNACREQKNTEKAQLHYEASITADPGNHLPYLNLATLLNHLNDLESARTVIERGLRACVQVHELRMLEHSLKNNRTISACLIVRDEEKLLPGCLDSIRDWVDEIIVVDTGSNDKSVSIALSYGAKVFNQQWEGNFSKHRNFSIEKATSDWIFIIDADERLCAEDVSRLKELVNSDHYSIISINVYNVYGKDERMTTFLPSVRLFKRDLNLRYEGIVHNRINFPSDAAIVRANVKLKHLGFDLSPEQMRKKFERSHALLEKQLQKNPNDAIALFNLAQLLRGAAKDNPDLFSDEIIKLASRAVALTNPNELLTRNIHLMCLDQLAWAHFYQGDLKLALNFAQKAIGYKKDYLDPLLLLGHIYSKSQEFDKAKEAYLNYIKIQGQYDPTSEKDNLILVNPDSRATAFNGLGIISEIKGEIKEARRNYLKVKELNPDYLDIQKRLDSLDQHDAVSSLGLSLGLKKLNSGEFEEAERLFLKAYEDSTDKRNVVLEAAQLYLDKEQFERAISLYNLWLNSAGDDSEILNDLGNCYFKMKQYEKANEYYEKASESITAPINVYRNLGLTCSILKQYGKAIISFRKYLSEKPDDVEIVSIMADLCLKVGDYKTAMPFYEKTLRFNPIDYNAIFNLSECYLNMGHEDSARIGYRRVLELNSNFEPAKKRLTQLEEVSTALSQ